MAPQITRLAMCFGVLIVGFFLLRSQAVPPGFGTDGWHRLEGPQSVANRAPRHAGKQACMACHEDKVKLSPHVKSGVACETCHGPAQAHVDDPEKVKPFRPSEREFCARCHGQIVGRRSSFPQIDPKTHNPGSKCIECHVIHPTEAQPK
ncbi:MAG: cytochrome c3 family protein [Fimbriimonadales bacterium]